jgi:hypothetical protein
MGLWPHCLQGCVKPTSEPPFLLSAEEKQRVELTAVHASRALDCNHEVHKRVARRKGGLTIIGLGIILRSGQVERNIIMWCNKYVVIQVVKTGEIMIYKV